MDSKVTGWNIIRARNENKIILLPVKTLNMTRKKRRRLLQTKFSRSLNKLV